jgi:small conductance mechanosensitive channel
MQSNDCLSSLGLTSDKLIERMYLFLPQLASAILIFIFFYLLAKIFNRVFKAALKKCSKKRALIDFLLSVSKTCFIVVGSTSALGTLGFNISAIVASLGLSGLALGLACKDVIANMISGILLLLYQTFDIEDKVEIKGVEGIVLAIDLRYTTVINERKELCYIPNSTLLTSNIRVIEKKQ